MFLLAWSGKVMCGFAVPQQFQVICPYFSAICHVGLFVLICVVVVDLECEHHVCC